MADRFRHNGKGKKTDPSRCDGLTQKDKNGNRFVKRKGGTEEVPAEAPVPVDRRERAQVRQGGAPTGARQKTIFSAGRRSGT